MVRGIFRYESTTTVFLREGTDTLGGVSGG